MTVSVKVFTVPGPRSNLGPIVGFGRYLAARKEALGVTIQCEQYIPGVAWIVRHEDGSEGIYLTSELRVQS